MNGLRAIATALSAQWVDPRWTAAVGLRLLGWTAVTLLVVGGVFVLAFAAFGNFSLEGFFLHVANLATRYNGADAARRTSFQHTLLIVTLIALCVVTVLRRGSLVRAFCDDVPPIWADYSLGGHRGS